MVKLGVENFFFKIPLGRTVLNFSYKTSGFCGAGCSFWYLFCQFFVILRREKRERETRKKKINKKINKKEKKRKIIEKKEIEKENDTWS